MSIAQELEKLTALRERGDLTHAEFGIAKERLLSGDVRDASQSTEIEPPPSTNVGRQKHSLLIAILSTIAVAFAAGSATLDPTPISLLAFALFAVAATLNWVQVANRRE